MILTGLLPIIVLCTIRPVVQYAAQQGSSTGIHDQVQGAAGQRRHVLVRSSELGMVIKQVAGGKLCEAMIIKQVAGGKL
jgi:hypothetical protein